MDDLLIGIDAGTSVIKAVAFTPDGTQIAVASAPSVISRLPDGGAEQDPIQTWEAVAAALRSLAEDVPDLAARTAGVGITAHGDGAWLVDGEGQPVGAGLTWLDSRAGSIVERWRTSEAGPALHNITGTALNPCLQSAQLAWLRDHRPERVERATAVLHPKDWLYLSCTGRPATDPTEGVLTFGDYRTRAYSDDVLEVLGLADVGHLRPEIVDGTVEHDPLTDDAAAATGLRPGTPVVLGPIDAVASALGSGLYEPNASVGVSILGSAGNHFRLYRSADDVVLAPEQVGYTIPFPVPGTWCAFISHMAATLNIDWLVGIVSESIELAGASADRAAILERLEATAAATTSDTVVFHPYIAEGERGPFVDPAARAQVLGLTERSGLGTLARAVYEGISFAARDCYRAHALDPSEIHLTGGAARSRLMRRLLAAAVGAPVRVVTRGETGAAGTALVAAASVGITESVVAGLDSWVEPYLGDAEEPEPQLMVAADQRYPAYRAGHEVTRPVWRMLNSPSAGSDPE